MIVRCDVCGGDCNKKPSHIKRHKHHYCSNECKAKGNSKTQFKQITIQCETCGVDFYKTPKNYQRSKHHYCSKKCTDRGHSKTKSQRITVECDTCGVDFEKTPCRVSERNYCSQGCSLKSHTGRSAIEFQLEEFLRELEFNFTTQQYFQSPEDYPEGQFKMFPDFYFPDIPLVVECNGSYYHADPNLYPNHSQLSEVQKAKVFRDQRKLHFFKSKNIPLLIIWERDNHHAEDILLGVLFLFFSCKAVGTSKRMLPAVIV